jgi:HK97 family phage portal protein
VGAICDLLERRATWKTGGNPQTPQYWLKKLFGAKETSSGIEIDEDKALTYSAVWAAINIISGAIGFLPFILYSRNGKAKDRKPAHPVYKLLHDRPNPYMDAMTFRETIQGHVLTWGNGYAEIERDGAARPKNIWPLLPNKTKPEVTETGRLRYEITDKDGKITYLPYENVLHIKGLSFDGIKGYSVINYAAESLSCGLAAEKYGAKFFGNNASPSGVLEHPESLSDESYNRLKESWENQHKGLDNAHRMAILEEGMKWHEIGIPPEDAQFLETRKFGITDVARWFSIPPHMLAELDRATFSNIENQGIMFVIYTLAKWLKRWELECNYKLLSTAEYERYFTEFLVDALLRGDTKSRYGAYQVAINSGWMSRNEARQKENMNPVDGLDEFLQPMNMAPVGTSTGEGAAAVRNLIEQTWQRILTKEVKALRTALKKPERFLSRMERFYEKHSSHVRKVLGPVLQATGNGFDIDQFAYDYVSGHRNMLISAFNDNREIGPVLDGWQLNEPSRLAATIVARKELINAE